MKRTVFIAAVLALVLAGGAVAADQITNKRAAVKQFPRWQQISNCFAQHNWILGVDTPAGGYAYVRGAGIHFQQWVAWWLPDGVLTADDSGLLTSSQTRVEKACV